MSSVATERQVIKLADEADENGLIEGRHYENAVILGPAVVTPLEDVTLDFNTFVAEPDGLFIEVPEGTPIQGAIGLRHVTFRRCELRNIAIAGSPKVLSPIKAKLEIPETVANPTAATPAPAAAEQTAAGRSSG